MKPWPGRRTSLRTHTTPITFVPLPTTPNGSSDGPSAVRIPNSETPGLQTSRCRNWELSGHSASPRIAYMGPYRYKSALSNHTQK